MKRVMGVVRSAEQTCLVESAALATTTATVASLPSIRETCISASLSVQLSDFTSLLLHRFPSLPMLKLLAVPILLYKDSPTLYERPPRRFSACSPPYRS